MNYMLSALTALTLTVCMLPAIPCTTANAITNDEIVDEQLSMPIVSIDTLGNSVNTKESYTSAKITIYDENGNIDTENADISIRLRGNVTLNIDKKAIGSSFRKRQIPLVLVTVQRSHGIW